MASRYVLWGKPYWMGVSIKVSIGTFTECRKALKQRSAEVNSIGRQSWTDLKIVPIGGGA